MFRQKEPQFFDIPAAVRVDAGDGYAERRAKFLFVQKTAPPLQQVAHCDDEQRFGRALLYFAEKIERTGQSERVRDDERRGVIFSLKRLA